MFNRAQIGQRLLQQTQCSGYLMGLHFHLAVDQVMQAVNDLTGLDFGAGCFVVFGVKANTAPPILQHLRPPFFLPIVVSVEFPNQSLLHVWCLEPERA